ncbi:hypothetical protein SLEP1_g18399 [Rubroshorea leprosula]|uniref:gibberellin 3beta-dioxygenase n=1 Tax=Rubroshorea leprosula TaxID=152421 RepID=A0AAV5J359_9ROSI|nr:hypothetical protein SLEP1_g18399 [Rubroshorea leprosula]
MNILNHIIPLDFENVIKLPDSHKWNDDHRSPVCRFPHVQVPLIDLASPHAASLIRQASEEWGVFQVKSHGIPMSLLNQVENQTRRLFALPEKRKLLAIRSPGGSRGYGMARISSFFPKLLWSEGFTIIGSPVEHAVQLWPHDHSSFCEIMEECQEEMNGLSEKLMSLMFCSVGLTNQDVKWFKPTNVCKNPQQRVLHLNSYPACPDPDQAMGLAPHTDSSLLTLLYQGNIAGLQVHRENMGWVPVQPVDGSLVVTVGDLMHIISNGRFKNCLHRAVVNRTNHRVSIAYFYGPPRDAKVSPLMKMIDTDHHPLYRPVTWNEYLHIKGTYFNKALELIRLNVDTKLG